MLTSYKYFDKLMMLIYDGKNQKVVECLFFDILEEYNVVDARLHFVYSEDYDIFKLPVTIDMCADFGKMKFVV